ncbi:MAG: DUF255 domain-containing protein [Bacteroidetes bacterium]|nr:DUF255 domain-containing protein [Bacteroidota bacterium]
MFLLILFQLFLTPDSKLKWYSYNDGVKIAKSQNKQILVDFYTDWCSWCKVMDQKTYADVRIVDYLNKNFILIKLNPEKDPPVNYNGQTYDAMRFVEGLGINGYPATGFFEPGDKFITVVPGYIEADEFLPMLEYVGQKKYYTISYQDFLKSRPR